MSTKEQRNFGPRVNERIRISPVRVIQDGKQLGVLPLYKAMNLAQEAELDLVEVAPNDRPPVCVIMDYGKYKYEQSIKEKERKHKSKTTEQKEVCLTPKIAAHDLETKIKSVQKFLSDGKKVQVTVSFKGREMAHKEAGETVINQVIEAVKELAPSIQKPQMLGKKMICRLEPKK